MSNKIIEHNDTVQLSLIHPIYKSVSVSAVDENGNSLVMKKDKLVKQIAIKKWFRKDAIDSVEEYVTTKNTIAKNRCIIHDAMSNSYYQTFHNPDELWFILRKEPTEREKITGFIKQ